MSMGEERSGSGRPIYRHEQSAPGALSAGDPELVAAIEGHITKHFGEPATAWHERVSPYVHIDVHIVEPRDDRPVFTLVTSGMSEKPMRANGEELYAELTMILPPSWPKPDTPGFRAPAGHWPYKLLNHLARLPHAFDTFLWAGHTVPNGDPPERYADNTELCGALIASPVIAPDGFETLAVGGREISFFAVFPLHADEMELKLEQGADALYDLLDEAELTEILDPDRPSAAPRRRRLFGR
jgi:hypothetical protein